MERTRRRITCQAVRWNTSKSQDSSLQIRSKIKTVQFFPHSRTVHLDIIKILLSTDA
jgi:hypothetical protein